MIFRSFSPRQQMTMLWWNMERYRNRDGIICDGSIRSGKTVSMTLGFFLWSMSRFNGQSFAICGRTIESLRRNVITHVPSWLEGVLTVKERRSENKLVVTMGNRQNTYYLFGGRDESSYTLIQGITLAGVLFDEVALMPRSFVEQAMARCSVSGSKFWFNCNPESPQHWFYREWIQQHTARNILYLHFTMADNFSLDAKIKARYEGMYAGVFYDRYIRGLWTVAEGLIYTMFSPGVHVVDTRNMEFDTYILSCDYGTLNPTSIGLWGLSAGKWYRIREYYYDGRKAQHQRTDEEHYNALEALAGELPIQRVIVDPSAASFIATIKKHEKFRVKHAKNDVLDGIRAVATHLYQKDFFIDLSCKDCIREFGLYRWDEKAAEDRPLKTDDHAMDDVRYFVQDAFKPASIQIMR